MLLDTQSTVANLCSAGTKKIFKNQSAVRQSTILYNREPITQQTFENNYEKKIVQ